MTSTVHRSPMRSRIRRVGQSAWYGSPASSAVRSEVVTTKCLLPIGDQVSYGNRVARARAAPASREASPCPASPSSAAPATPGRPSSPRPPPRPRGHRVQPSLPAEQVPGVDVRPGRRPPTRPRWPRSSPAPTSWWPRSPRAVRSPTRSATSTARSPASPTPRGPGCSSSAASPRCARHRAAPRFVEDLTQVPAALHGEILAGAALITEDLPAASRDARLGVRQPGAAVRLVRPRRAAGRVPGR